jgi:hypothetical protein
MNPKDVIAAHLSSSDHPVGQSFSVVAAASLVVPCGGVESESGRAEAVVPWGKEHLPLPAPIELLGLLIPGDDCSVVRHLGRQDEY